MKTLLSLTSRSFAMTRVRVFFQNVGVLSGGEVLGIETKGEEPQSWGIRKHLATLALAVLAGGVNAQESPRAPDAPDIRTVAIATQTNVSAGTPIFSASPDNPKLGDTLNPDNSIIQSVAVLGGYSELAHLTYCVILLDGHKLDDYTGAIRTSLEEIAKSYGVGNGQKPILPEGTSDIKVSLVNIFSRLYNGGTLTPVRRDTLKSSNLIPQFAYGWGTLGPTYKKFGLQYLDFKDILKRLGIVEEENYEGLVGLFNQGVIQGETKALIISVSTKDGVAATNDAVKTRIAQIGHQSILIGDVIMHATLGNTQGLADLKRTTNLDTLFSNPNDAGIKKIILKILEGTGVPLSRSILDQVAAWSSNRKAMLINT